MAKQSIAAGAKGAIILTPEQYLRYARRPKDYPELQGAKITVMGDVDLSATELGRQVKKLPSADIKGNLRADETCALGVAQGVTVRGDTDISRSNVASFREGFRACGNFNARYSRIFSVEGCCEKNADFSGSQLYRLSSDFECRGDLSVSGCKWLGSVDCQVGGNFSAYNSGLKRLGKNFKVGGNVEIVGGDGPKKIGYIGNPDNVRLSDIPLREIEPSFKCRGELQIDQCGAIKHISPQIDIGSLALEIISLPTVQIDKTLDRFRATSCRTLENIIVNCREKVEIEKCQRVNFDQIGRNVRELELINAGVRELRGAWGGEVKMTRCKGPLEIPPDFSCKGDFTLFQCNLLHKIEGNIGGNLKITESWDLQQLPAGLQIQGNLDIISYPSHDNLTLGCKVGGNFTSNGRLLQGGMTDCRISTVVSTSDSFCVEGNVDLSHAGRLKYMRGFVGGNLNVDESSIVSLEQGLVVKGNLSARDCNFLTKIDCEVGGNSHISGRKINRSPGKQGRGKAYHPTVLRRATVDSQTEPSRNDLGR